MARPKKFPDELIQRGIRLALESDASDWCLADPVCRLRPATCSGAVPLGHQLLSSMLAREDPQMLVEVDQRIEGKQGA